MAQPLKKKEVKKFDIGAFKKKISSAPVADKPMEWIIMPKAFQDALHIPGIPAGYMSGVRGWSDTGKSTIKNCLIAIDDIYVAGNAGDRVPDLVVFIPDLAHDLLKDILYRNDSDHGR